jgi:hypothetical protein
MLSVTQNSLVRRKRPGRAMALETDVGWAEPLSSLGRAARFANEKRKRPDSAMTPGKAAGRAGPLSSLGRVVRSANEIQVEESHVELA